MEDNLDTSIVSLFYDNVYRETRCTKRYSIPAQCEGDHFLGSIVHNMDNSQIRSVHTSHGHADCHGFGRFHVLINIGIRKGQVHRTDFSGFTNHGSYCGSHAVSRYRYRRKYRVFRHGIFRHHNRYSTIRERQSFLICTDRTQCHAAGNKCILCHISLTLFIHPAIHMLFIRCVRQLSYLLTEAAHTRFSTAAPRFLIGTFLVGSVGFCRE